MKTTEQCLRSQIFVLSIFAIVLPLRGLDGVMVKLKFANTKRNE